MCVQGRLGGMKQRVENGILRWRRGGRVVDGDGAK